MGTDRGTDYRERAHAMHDLVQRYYIDLSSVDIRGERVDHWNSALAVLTYLTNGRHLLKGDPSTGKTSLASLVSGIFGGVPPSIAMRMLVKGTPDLTREDINGRFHYGKLNGQEELVVWPLRHLMPFFSIDELFRIPTKLQSMLLTGVEDGGWDYAGSYFIDVGARPGFFTVNPKDSGSFELTYALLDRLSVSSEHWPLPALQQDKMDIANMLRDVELTGKLSKDILPASMAKAVRNAPTKAIEEIVRGIEDVGKDCLSEFEKRRDMVDGLRGSYREQVLTPLLDGAEPLTEEEMQAVRMEMRSIPFDQATLCMKFWFEACLNINQVWGINRSEDAEMMASLANNRNWPDSSQAVALVRGPFTNRAQRDTDRLARALSWWMGKPSIDPETYRTAMVYAVNHRLEYQDHFRDSHLKAKRNRDMQVYLTQELLEDMSKDFSMKEKDYLGIVTVVTNPDFDPTKREGQKGYDPKKSLSDKHWKELEDVAHPVLEAVRRELRERGIEVDDPAAKKLAEMADAEKQRKPKDDDEQ